MSIIDNACIGSAIGITVIYNVILFFMAIYHPSRVRHTLNQTARKAWAIDVMRTKRDILGVQTLRNSMMASTLLASTSLTLSSLVAAYLYKIGDESGMWNDAEEAVHPVMKLFTLLCSFMFSFFAFMQSLRSSSTASFLIGMRIELPEANPDRVGDIVQRSALFYSIGSRAFVFSFVLLLWIFGAPAALAGAIVVTAVYGFNDYADG